MNNYVLDNVKSYKYLGITITPNARFKETIKYLCSQAQKAMFSFIKKARALQLPLDVQLDLFHNTVMPIALYGCEVWGFEDCGLVERLHLKFCKYILKLKSSTPTCMIYGELGEYPVNIQIKIRMINFWLKLVNGRDSKYSTIIYHILLFMYHSGKYCSMWLTYVKQILDEAGFNDVWAYTTNFNSSWINKAVKQHL